VDTYESYWHFLDKEQFIKVVCAIGRTWPEWIFAANHGAANYDRVVAFLRRFDNEQAVAWAQLFIEDAAQRIVDLRSVDLGVFAHLSLSTREAMVRRSRLSIPHLVQLLAEMAESGMRWHTFDLLTGLTHIFMACDEEQYPAWLKLRNNLPVHGIDVQIDDLFRRVHVKRGQVVTRADNEVGCGGLRIRNRGGYLVPLRYPDGQRVRSGDVLIHSRRDESWTRCLLCGAKRVFRATLVSRGEADT
jgi:hypothetical protein